MGGRNDRGAGKRCDGNHHKNKGRDQPVIDGGMHLTLSQQGQLAMMPGVIRIGMDPIMKFRHPCEKLEGEKQ